jgi:maltose alpha-D-glucosyltransferase / alpha-amylase
MDLFNVLSKYWNALYPESPEDDLKKFISEIEKVKKKILFQKHKPEWYKDAVVYSLYVDQFNHDFTGLEEKLGYLQDLGVNCLWLLPILDSPMKDAGFDIRNYDQVRTELLAIDKNSTIDEQRQLFRDFLAEAHKRGLKVIFDIAINHTSDEHPWFIESKKSSENPYRNYYIWSQDKNLYKDARIIFEGLCESNWQKEGNWYYFHRFFEFQPDLNYKNSQVLIEMTRNFLFWLSQGVDGFRGDAIPYIWKEDGTACENHPTLHAVVKFFRAVLDYVRPHTLLLAEACQKPNEVIRYFGNGDECNAGYHFPLMPMIFKSIAAQSSKAVTNILSTDVTPVIPESAQWFTFLRCHDELSLELVYVSEEDRKFIHDHYCRQPLWDFRLGQGVAARLSELMGRNPDKIGLAFSIMLTLPGTPIIYYGDEFGTLNDEANYREMIKVSGKDDTRFLVRGKMDWKKTEFELKNPHSYSAKVYNQVRKMVNTRNLYQCFGRGKIEWLELTDKNNNALDDVLIYKRFDDKDELLIIQNLSDEEQVVILPEFLAKKSWVNLLENELTIDKTADTITLLPLVYFWLLVKPNSI